VINGSLLSLERLAATREMAGRAARLTTKPSATGSPMTAQRSDGSGRCLCSEGRGGIAGDNEIEVETDELIPP